VHSLGRYGGIEEEPMPAADTTIEAARRQREALAGTTASERATMAFEMSQLVRQLVIDGIRSRRPELSPDELALQLIERLHGKEMAAAVAASAAFHGR
jgi:hypothetical protein